VTHYYPDQILRIEVGVLVGALAMLFFPLMSQGFVQTTSALYGLHQEEGFKPIVPFMSFMFGAWALLLLFFFFRRHDTELEMAAKLTGVAASTIAVVKYDLIVAIAVRYLGSGAGEIAVALLIGLSVIAVLVLLSRRVRKLAASSVPAAPLETRDTSRPS
jgi:surface polysaccharide O-acyltransferase-like enzyme